MITYVPILIDMDLPEIDNSDVAEMPVAVHWALGGTYTATDGCRTS